MLYSPALCAAAAHVRQRASPLSPAPAGTPDATTQASEECRRVDARSTVRQDVLAFQRLGVVQTALQVLQKTTGMRIALVARVTEDSWTACAVLDNANFGFKPGDELPLHTTY